MKSSANLLPPFGCRRCLTTASGSRRGPVKPVSGCPLHPEVDYVFVAAAAAIFCVCMCLSHSRCVCGFFVMFCFTKQKKVSLSLQMPGTVIWHGIPLRQRYAAFKSHHRGERSKLLNFFLTQINQLPVGRNKI